jgi:hypothetical protein
MVTLAVAVAVLVVVDTVCYHGPVGHFLKFILASLFSGKFHNTSNSALTMILVVIVLLDKSRD